ncbi:MAG: 4-hydroxy-3-methylbut-2-enyl diphosphate reductase [Kiritimatiellae bacterium]|nr:4-hydroxy-3-methylbut-2-enyl diphosphate reductase [Kiritimatiellia bacterium]
MRKKCVIHLAGTAGFCFGVRRAIRTALELGRSGKTIHMLGDLVHNQDVIARLEKTGIKKISRLGRGRGKILLIRAHGAGRRLMSRARKQGYEIVDATCPMVHLIQKKVREMDRRGYRVIVLGDRYHEEVLGIAGQISRKTMIIDGIGNIPWPQIKKIKKAAVVVQSTQNMDHVLPVVDALKGKIRELKFFNTICRPTRMKQAETKNLARLNDVVIVIGSRLSANTRRLFEISRALNPRAHRVESADQISPTWLQNAKTIGITAGASTPQSATRAVIERIRRLVAAPGKSTPAGMPEGYEFHLFLLAGQSNMAGRGVPAACDKKTHPRVLTFTRDNRWAPAVDPIHFDKPAPGVGPGRTFGLALADKCRNIVIGLIPCAAGGSPISVWRPRKKWTQTNSRPYDDAVRRTRRAMKSGVLKGILWHQGEGDCAPGRAEIYEKELTRLIRRFRMDLRAPGAPFICGELGPSADPGTNRFRKIINKSLRKITRKVRLTGLASSAGLRYKPDKIHFDSASQREFGRRYAAAYMRIAACKTRFAEEKKR